MFLVAYLRLWPVVVGMCTRSTRGLCSKLSILYITIIHCLRVLLSSMRSSGCRRALWLLTRERYTAVPMTAWSPAKQDQEYEVVAQPPASDQTC